MESRAEKQLEWLWENCKIVYWPRDDDDPIEHNRQASKDSREMLEAEMLKENHENDIIKNS